MRLHSNLVSALQHPSTWAGFSGVMSSMGTQIDKPFSLLCYCLSAVFSLIAIIIRPPQQDENSSSEDKEQAS